jgi:hypothetical protein
MTAFRRGFRSLLARLLGGQKRWSTNRPRSVARLDSRTIAVLLQSDVVNDKTVAEYQKIAEAVKDFARPHFLLHVRPDTPFDARLEPAVYPFTDEILKTMSCEPWTKSFVPGSAHFPLLHFFLEQNQYEYYWLIEYDVRFSGDWREFFESFREVEADFLTSCVRHPPDEPDWYWWNSLRHPESFIPPEQRLASFNPIYRISNPALRHILESHRRGWVGHFEVLIPTLLHHQGFKLVDFGGEGSFVRAGGKNKFYTAGAEGTFRHRPCYVEAGPLVNKLYHPVKREFR